jgi:hypothetical protein
MVVVVSEVKVVVWVVVSVFVDVVVRVATPCIATKTLAEINTPAMIIAAAIAK